MDLLFVVGALMGLDGLAIPPATTEAALAAQCQAGVTIACDASWHTPDGRIDVAALQAAAGPGCDAGDPVACAAFGMGGSYSSVGVITGWAPGYGEARGALARACDLGVARACTERARMSLYAESTKGTGEGSLEPVRVMAALCAEGEPTACVWDGYFRWAGVGGTPDEAAGNASWKTACEAGHARACWLGSHDPDEVAPLCAAGSVEACAELSASPDAPGRGDAGAVVAGACLDGQGGACALARVTGSGVERLEQALRQCEGSPSRCVEVAALLRGPHATLDEAALVVACERGEGAACHGLGWLGLRAVESSSDLAAAAAHVASGCDAGFAPACRELAALQLERAAPGARPKEAQARLEGFCRSGSGLACETLARVWTDGGDPARGALYAAARASLAGRLLTDAWLDQAGLGRLGEAFVSVRKRVRPQYSELARSLEWGRNACRATATMNARGVPIAVAAHGCHPYFLRSTEEALMRWRFRSSADADESVFELLVEYRVEGATGSSLRTSMY